MMNQNFIKRINNFYEWMNEHGIEGALITAPVNIYYFTGFYSNPHERFMGLFLLREQDPTIILPELDVNSAKAKGVKQVIGYSDAEGADLFIKKLNVNKEALFAMEENELSHRRFKWLTNLLQTKNVTDAEEGILSLRMKKDEQEFKYLKEAAEWADKAIEFGVHAIQIGKSELEIIAEIEYKLKQQGIEKMSFDTMVLTGLKTASPHGRPDKTLIKNGDFVLFDLGVVVNGYCSDISRTVIVGKSSEKHIEIYSTVKEGQQKAIDIVKPGILAKEIDLTARNYINEKGYGEYFIHRIGHGLGIEVHELPSIHEKNNDILKEGMVFTIEPGIYVPEVGGVRIEDDVFVTSEGVHVLTSFSKELIYV